MSIISMAQPHAYLQHNNGGSRISKFVEACTLEFVQLFRLGGSGF